MRPSRSAQVVAVACAAILIVPGFAAAQAAPEQYKPQIGQPGKDVVWVPQPAEMVEKMLDFASVTPRDFVVDLGSGDGRNVIAAAKRGARALGVEYNPDLVELSRRRAQSEGVADRAAFVQGDMFEADFSQATVLALFLLPDNLQRLSPKFMTLEPGTRIVANTFRIPDWEPDASERAETDCQTWCELLLWIVPARVAGAWRLPQGTLTFTQEFQMVSGTLASDNGTTSVEHGRLRGAEIQFTLGGAQYVGRVNGNTIEGTVTSSGREAPFRATRSAS